LTQFCEYLSQNSLNLKEEQKVYLAYYWVTKNIVYDHNGRLNNNAQTNPDAFFQSRKTVCSGYSRLFRNLLLCMDYPESKIKNISGYAKGSEYSLFKSFTKIIMNGML
jgi:hypothetical protein